MTKRSASSVLRGDAKSRAIFDRALASARLAIAKEIEREPECPYALDCGFAWVVVNPATGLFVNYCRREARRLMKIATDDGVGQRGTYNHGSVEFWQSLEHGTKAFGKGWVFWTPGNWGRPIRSIRIHLAGAHAFKEGLVASGIRAELRSDAAWGKRQQEQSASAA